VKILNDYELQDSAEEIRQNVLLTASYIAYIRWYNETKECRIKFDGLGYKQFYKPETMRLDNHKLLDVLNKRSKNKTETLTVENIENFIQKIKTDDYLNLCNGHDVTDLLALAINTPAEQFRGNLRIAFQFSHFVQTKLYKDIAAWQAQNGLALLHDNTAV
jgi:hypothetical protein